MWPPQVGGGLVVKSGAIEPATTATSTHRRKQTAASNGTVAGKTRLKEFEALTVRGSESHVHVGYASGEDTQGQIDIANISDRGNGEEGDGDTRVSGG